MLILVGQGSVLAFARVGAENLDDGTQETFRIPTDRLLAVPLALFDR